jgi:hypothetical protein
MDLVGNDVDILHEEIEYLVGHIVENDVDTLHEERIHLVGFSFIRVIDFRYIYIYILEKICKQKKSTHSICPSCFLISQTFYSLAKGIQKNIRLLYNI